MKCHANQIIWTFKCRQLVMILETTLRPHLSPNLQPNAQNWLHQSQSAPLEKVSNLGLLPQTKPEQSWGPTIKSLLSKMVSQNIWGKERTSSHKSRCTQKIHKQNTLPPKCLIGWIQQKSAVKLIILQKLQQPNISNTSLLRSLYTNVAVRVKPQWMTSCTTLDSSLRLTITIHSR